MGSVEAYSTSGGKRYRDPERRDRHKSGFLSKRDAEDYLATVTVSKNRGEYIDPASAKVTIGDLAGPWLVAQSHLKPSALRPVEIAWRVHAAKRWAAVRVSDVTFSRLQSWVSGMGGSATTVLRSYGVLASILDVAVRDSRILANPARGVNLPRKGGKERIYLSHDQVERLATNAGDKGTVVCTLAYTGLRWGELVGLRVMDPDMLRKRIKVQQNAVMVGGRIIIGTPKSHEARAVPFPTFLGVALAALCEGKKPTDLVFGDGDFLRPPDSRRGWWITAVKLSIEKDADFPPKITRHDLRHTAASLAISAGANVKVIQRMLGHASAAMTLDVYGDPFDDDLDTVSDALDRARTESNVRFLRVVGNSTNG
jgi:integrase